MNTGYGKVPWTHNCHGDFPGGSVIKNLPSSAGDSGLTPAQGLTSHTPGGAPKPMHHH